VVNELPPASEEPLVTSPPSGVDILEPAPATNMPAGEPDAAEREPPAPAG
jgi:hypothetical protein